MRIEKTWSTVWFYGNEAKIEATLNYEAGTFSLTHSNNDANVTFGKNGESIELAMDRAKCVVAALKYIKEELANYQS